MYSGKITLDGFPLSPLLGRISASGSTITRITIIATAMPIAIHQRRRSWHLRCNAGLAAAPSLVCLRDSISGRDAHPRGVKGGESVGKESRRVRGVSCRNMQLGGIANKPRNVKPGPNRSKAAVSQIRIYPYFMFLFFYSFAFSVAPSRTMEQTTPSTTKAALMGKP